MNPVAVCLVALPDDFSHSADEMPGKTYLLSRRQIECGDKKLSQCMERPGLPIPAAMFRIAAGEKHSAPDALPDSASVGMPRTVGSMLNAY